MLIPSTDFDRIVTEAGAEYRSKGAVELNLALDHEGYLPRFGIVTDGNVANVKAAHQIHFAPRHHRR